MSLTELFGHKAWATSHVLEWCLDLDDAALDFTRVGSFGSVRETLRHLVHSDAGYQRWLLGEERTVEGHDGLSELLALYRDTATRWPAVVTDDELTSRLFTSSDGWEVTGRVIVAQACHHDDEHRTQVLSLLGAQGLDVPSLGVWEYAIAAGQMTEQHE